MGRVADCGNLGKLFWGELIGGNLRQEGQKKCSQVSLKYHVPQLLSAEKPQYQTHQPGVSNGEMSDCE